MRHVHVCIIYIVDGTKCPYFFERVSYTVKLGPEDVSSISEVSSLGTKHVT